MPSQFPAFRLSVARQMADHRDRLADRIRREAAKHGESPADLAHALRIHPSTSERWFRGERTPQPRHRKQLAEHWELPFDEFEFDLEVEDQQVRDQLDRIEEKVDEILERLKEDVSESSDDDARRVPDALPHEQDRQQDAPTADEPG